MKKNLFLAGITGILLVFGLILTGCVNPAADDSGSSGSGGAAVVGAATVTGVTVSPSTANVARGGTKTFTVVVAGSNNPAQTVTWTVSGGTPGTFISSAGVLTVAAAEPATTILTVKATSTVDATKTGTAAVTVTADLATVDSVTVSPSTANVAKGGTQKFTASVAGTNSPSQSVIWTVTGGTNLATSISPSGDLTVAAAETAGNILTVKATSTVDAAKTDTADVTVTDVTATVTSVTVAPLTANVAKGGTQIFTATVTGTYSPSQSVTWTVSGGTAGPSISNDGYSPEGVPITGGILTVAAGETGTTLSVTATSDVNPTISGKATVTITAGSAGAATGPGSPSDPFQITTAAGLAAMADGLDKHYKLMSDITLTSAWTPVGTMTDPFTGSLDGNGKTITFGGGSSLSWKVDGNNAYAGLFGVIDNTGNEPAVKDLAITGTLTLTYTTAGETKAGALAGYVAHGIISGIAAKVTLSVTSTNSDDFAGNIVGWNEGTIKYSYNTGNISVTSTKDACAGGIVGINFGIINGTYSSGTVLATSTSTSTSVINYVFAGGIAGGNHDNVISRNVALTTSVNATGVNSFRYRLACDMYFSPGEFFDQNWALSTMTLNGGTVISSDPTDPDGADFTSPTSQSSWTASGSSGPGWTFGGSSPWKWVGTIPKLAWE